MDIQPIIKIEHLSSGYNGKQVLKDISLDIYPNEIMAVLGTSGCGKTTLLKHLIGLLKPDKGTIKLFNKDIVNIDEVEFNNLLKQVGVLFQNGALLNSISLGENIAIPLEQHTNLSADLIEYLVRLKLKLVGLDHVYDYFPSELSGGMRKRAALARAIALDPKILFADEPGAGLDPVTASSLDTLLLSLKQQLGMTLIIVTHETASIKRIADRVTYLHEGKALFSGSLSEALKSNVSELRAFFHSSE
ncbi:MAG: ATP-binding cassette domain-containing protein [Calditrichales bacterium]|nr:ATP-binding cassette domain-containing protein [Calditrichales bacterium]